MRVQVIYAFGITVVFLIGLTLVYGYFSPISGDVFAVIAPYYIYLGSWVFVLVAWKTVLPKRAGAIMIPLALIVLLACILPLWIFVKSNHTRRLHDAARYNHLKILSAELAFYGKKQEDLNNALTDAVIGGNDRVVAYLISNGANTNGRLLDNDTVLMLAVKSKSAETTRLLLASGADINAKNKDGMTALMWGAQTNALEPVRVLLDANADKSLLNHKGKSALMLAKEFHFDQIESILK